MAAKRAADRKLEAPPKRTSKRRRSPSPPVSEQNLVNSEAKYRRLFETAQDAILILDGKTGQITDANPFIKDMLGYTLEELLGKRLWEIGTFRDIVASKAAFQELKRKGYVRYQHLPLLSKDGRVLDVEFVSNRYKVDEQEVFQCNIRNITERKKVEQALRDSEERYRALVEQSLVGIGLSHQNRVIFANTALLDIFGYNDLEEFTKVPLLDHIAPAFREPIAIRMRKVAQGENVEPIFEYDIVRKDGEIRKLQAMSSWVKSGGKTYTQTVFQDITERRRTEERVRVADERLEYLISSASVVLYSAEVHGNYPATFISSNIAQLTGYEAKEFLDNSDFWYEHVHPDDRQIADTEVPKIFEKGLHIYEYRFRCKDGEYIWVRDEMKLVIDEAGKPMEIIGVWLDITERKQAEEALLQSEERYRTILEEMDESYYEVDLAGNFTFVNDALCRRLGHSREELIGMNYRAYTPKERTENTFKTFNQVFRTGQPLEGIPAVAVASDGSLRFVERSIFPITNEEGKTIGFRGISRDITERKLAEEERRQLELKAQITSRLASVGEMAAGVAHEINNPLTGITGYAQLLMERKNLPADVRSDLEAINDGAQRVAGIVQRLLAFSRQTKPQRKLVDINELIESTLILRAYHLRVSNIDVVTRLAPDFLETVVDPGQIQQVLLNLIVNAETEMNLAHGKGKLTITTEKTDKTIKVSVKDNGPGIKPEIMDRIFDPFFTTRDVGQGTGLGLSLCYGIVAEHNGKIYAKSQPGKGATFIVELPIVTEVLPIETAKPKIRKSRNKPKASILVVDDEAVVTDIAKRVLSADGHRVDTTGNALEALSKIKNKKYDLILLDIKMPGMNGIDLYKRIQRTARPLAQKVVFMTGDIMGADTEKFLARTRASHIEKPFNSEQLNGVVSGVLDNSTDV